MPLKPESQPDAVKFFTSSAWADLRQLLEAGRPSYPPISADALTTASQCRRREGYELCIETLLRESVCAPVVAADGKPETKAAKDPMQAALNDLMGKGEYVDTHTD